MESVLVEILDAAHHGVSVQPNSTITAMAREALAPPARTCGARHPTRSDVGPCLRESPNHAGEPHKGAGPFRNVVAWTTDAAPDPVPMTFTPGAVVHGRLVRMEVTPAGSTIQLVTDGGESLTVHLHA